MGRRGVLRPRAGGARSFRVEMGRVPRRRRRFRRRLLQHQRARGDVDRPATSTAPRDGLGGRRTRGPRPRVDRRLTHRRLHRHDPRRLPAGGRGRQRGRGPVRLHRKQLQPRVRTHRLPPRRARTRVHRGLRLLLEPARRPHGLPQPARRRERPRAGRWRLDHARAQEDVLGLRPGHAVADRRLPRLRRGRRRLRVGGGLRGPAAQASRRRGRRRRPRPRGHPRHGGQPGRPHRQHRDPVA